VSDAEEVLHRNVQRPELVGRASAWRSALEPWEGRASEWWMRRALEEHGYEPWFLTGSTPWTRFASVTRAWLVHIWAALRYVVRRSRRLWRQPGRILEMARLRRARWRG
jgi:hypothetical protein